MSLHPDVGGSAQMTGSPPGTRRPRRRWLAAATIAALVGGLTLTAQGAASAAAPAASVVPTVIASAAQSPFGPNVKVFDPSMSTSDIQAQVDAISAQQIGNQFGPARYALLFKPGTYGSAAAPLNFQVGYYTAVAGLGLSPDDVVINGSVYAHNQCENN